MLNIASISFITFFTEIQLRNRCCIGSSLSLLTITLNYWIVGGNLEFQYVCKLLDKSDEQSTQFENVVT